MTTPGCQHRSLWCVSVDCDWIGGAGVEESGRGGQDRDDDPLCPVWARASFPIAGYGSVPSGREHSARLAHVRASGVGRRFVSLAPCLGEKGGSRALMSQFFCGAGSGVWPGSLSYPFKSWKMGLGLRLL